MISRVIEWCARNRFLVFAGVLFLLLAGIWSLQRIPLDALPDISDVQVIVHTPWPGRPPNVIEDQVTYPIVTTLLAAPHVKAVRAQTMFGDSYVFVVFQDGTDLYWARSRVLEYIQQLGGRLPQGAQPMIGPDATGVGWVFEYALVDRTRQHSLADLRAIQDWQVRYQLETIPGVAEVATIGGFVKQYQVQLDPNKLLAYGIPLTTVIDRVRASTNEVGGRVLEMNGARYMVRGLGYLTSLKDLEEERRGNGMGRYRWESFCCKRTGVGRRKSDRPSGHPGHARGQRTRRLFQLQPDASRFEPRRSASALERDSKLAGNHCRAAETVRSLGSGT